MPEETARITEDASYKPSSPETPAKRFFIEADGYRWTVHVWRYTIKETGSTVYRARAEEEGHCSYGITVNETLNDLKSIMLRKLKAYEKDAASVSLDSVRCYLDPMDAAREDLKVAESLSGKPLLARLLGL